MTTTARPNYRFVNKKQPRLEGIAKVTGRTQYTADVKLPRLAHMKLLTAPHAHAIIRKLDTTRAKAYPGVVGVFTADDLPAHLQRDGAARLTTPFAWKEVVFFGQPVAAVVADDPSIAEEALDLIDVEYEALPAVMDILDALKMDCPPVRGSLSGSDNSELAAHSVVAATEDVHSDKNPPNVTHRLVWARGDVEAGFKEADYIVERKFHASWVHQGYIETMSATVDCDLDNNYHIWLSTQGSFTSRENMAKMLGVPESKIVVEFLEMGGGFGGKIQPYAATYPAMAARILKRPVKFVMSRSQDIRAGNPAPQGYFEIKLAAKKDMTITALKAKAVYDSGAFPGSPLMAGGNLLGSYYKTPNQEIEGIEVITNRVNQGALRAPGTPQATFAIESAVDILCHEAGFDPWEFRMKNGVETGDPMANGRNFGKIGLKETIAAFKNTQFWKNKDDKPALPGKKVGVGWAIGGWLGGGAPSSAAVFLTPDGSLNVEVGSSDISGVNTSFAMIVAEIFNTPLNKISVKLSNTAASPYASMSAGSKTLRTVGLAVHDAAIDARSQMFKVVAEKLECSPDDLESVDGVVRVKGTPDKSMTFGTLGTMSTGYGSPVPVIFGRGTVGSPTMAPGFALQAVKVAVDETTGVVEILDACCVQDVGFAINPLAVESQIQGGMVQSLSLGFSEEIVWDNNGVLRNPTLLDYRLPTALDVPNIEVAIVEVPVEGAGPFGAKGMGEPPIAPGAAALANAVFDAVGARVDTIPVTAERIMKTLGKL